MLARRAAVGFQRLVFVFCAATACRKPDASSREALVASLSVPRAAAATTASSQGRVASPSVVAAATAAPPAAPCSADMVLVEHSCVDRYEAHLLETQADGSLVPHPAYARPDSSKRYVAGSSPGVKPQAYISQVEAAAACEHASKRLCQLTEWYRACSGSAGTTYPYGAEYESKRCNTARPHLLSMLHGPSSSQWSYADFNDPKLDQTPGFLADTGERTGCVTPEGVYDLVGNLHEWVADRVDRTLVQKLPVPAVIERRIGRHTGNGIFMGGFFSTTNEHGAGCTFTTAAHEPRYHDYSTGFRCCRDAASIER